MDIDDIVIFGQGQHVDQVAGGAVELHRYVEPLADILVIFVKYRGFHITAEQIAAFAAVFGLGHVIVGQAGEAVSPALHEKQPVHAARQDKRPLKA